MTKCLIILFLKSSNQFNLMQHLQITGAIRGSSREKLYQELGFESLQQRWWYRKLCLFFKIIKNQSPKYPFQLIPTARESYMTRHKNRIPLLNIKHDYLKISFFSSTIIEQNNLDSNIKNSESLTIFKKHILAFIRPAVNSTFHCHRSCRFKINYKVNARFKSPSISQI